MRPGEFPIMPHIGARIRAQVRHDIEPEIPAQWCDAMDKYKDQPAWITISNEYDGDKKRYRNGTLRVTTQFDDEALAQVAGGWTWTLAMFKLIHPASVSGPHHWFMRSLRNNSTFSSLRDQFAEDGFGILPIAASGRKAPGYKLARFDGGRISNEIADQAKDFLVASILYPCNCPACKGEKTLEEYLK